VASVGAAFRGGRSITSKDRQPIRTASLLAVERLVRADLQRSNDGGKTWEPPEAASRDARRHAKGQSNKFAYDTSPDDRQAADDAPVYDGTQRSVGVQAGGTRAVAHGSRHRLRRVEDAALFKFRDGGASWQSFQGCAATAPARSGSPARAACACTRSFSIPKNDRIYVAISAAGAFRSDDAGKNLEADHRGLQSKYIPDPTPSRPLRSPHCDETPKRSGSLFMQKHWDVMRSEDAGDNWKKISGRPADGLRLRHRRARAGAGHDLRRSHQERLRALRA